ncbi:MAG: phosphoribosylanthranilate isomerase [Rhodobacteraceae bacterium]|nr:phosphoribosylanthranilate isomerase [Paracoccaceae bacterium]
MPSDISVKICGLTRPDHVAAAASAGADYVGFVFFDKSPRNLGLVEAGELARQTPAGMCKVALTVDAEDAMLDVLLAEVLIDMLQLHGSETPERVAAVKARYGLPVMKAIGVATEDDLPKLAQYALVADQLLVDAKPPKGTKLPGGNGVVFDWQLIADHPWTTPWMLAGGLTTDTVGNAIAQTRTRQVDVSSGVEASPGAKDPAKIAEFVRAART